MNKIPLQRILLGIILGGGVLLIALFMFDDPSPKTGTITVHGVPYSVYIADTDETRVQGLSDIPELPPEITGMLFIFPHPDQHGFWMKDMHFSIHMYWLNSDMHVVHRELNVAPESFPTVYEPAEPAVYVLEIPSNTKEFPILALGDSLRLLTDQK